MEKLTDQKRFRPWMGLIFFAVYIAIFIFLGPIFSEHFGLVGTAMYEFLFLAVSVLMCIICRVKIKEVFPIKKPRFREIAGCVVLSMGVAATAAISNVLIALFFPEMLNDISERNLSITTMANPIVTILVISVVPAICEEAMYRGVIQSTMRPIKNDFVIALIVGFLFAANHMSIASFLGVFVMGKKNNILLTSLMHFFNNFRSVVLLLIVTNLFPNTLGTTDYASTSKLQLIGSLLVAGFSAPILITLGWFLLCQNKEKSYKKQFIITGITSGAMYFTGIVIVIASVLPTVFKTLNPVFIQSDTFEEDGKQTYELNISEDGTYNLQTNTVSVNHKDYHVKISIYNEDNENIYSKKLADDNFAKLNDDLDLEEGEYTVVFTTDLEDGDIVSVSSSIYQR